ncbi:MAG: tetratricopeptide repeat protein, partial [Gammaproteobacteria bacterium]
MHAQEGKGRLAPLLENMGDYRYPVSHCPEEAQQFFDQGLRLYYAYYFPEAIASFREAARSTPDCAMAYWGEALAIAPNPNSRY